MATDIYSAASSSDHSLASDSLSQRFSRLIGAAVRMWLRATEYVVRTEQQFLQSGVVQPPGQNRSTVLIPVHRSADRR